MENPRSLSRNFWVFSAVQKGKCQKPKREKSLCSLHISRPKDTEKEIPCPPLKLYTRTFYSYLVEAWGVPFKVDFVSEAKCQERVFDARTPT
jgi:hypothetical protein